jgi:hypothetical protein
MPQQQQWIGLLRYSTLLPGVRVDSCGKERVSDRVAGQKRVAEHKIGVDGLVNVSVISRMLCKPLAVG